MAVSLYTLNLAINAATDALDEYKRATKAANTYRGKVTAEGEWRLNVIDHCRELVIEALTGPLEKQEGE